MKESRLRQKLKEKLGIYGLIWFPAKIKYYENDIFGCFDCIWYVDGRIILIQVTTLTNLSHRRKKILNHFPRGTGGIPKDSYIYAWNDKLQYFKVVNVYEEQQNKLPKASC